MRGWERPGFRFFRKLTSVSSLLTRSKPGHLCTAVQGLYSSMTPGQGKEPGLRSGHTALPKVGTSAQRKGGLELVCTGWHVG